MTSNSATLDQSLKGIRVVDVTHKMASPYCTMLQGGTEIIKIEQPGWDADGPYTRLWRRRGQWVDGTGLRGLGDHGRSLGVVRRARGWTLRCDAARMPAVSGPSYGGVASVPATLCEQSNWETIANRSDRRA